MIDRHALEVIEYDKIRRQIAEQATSALGREAIEEIEPATDARDVVRSLEISDEMARAVRWDDPVPMGGVRDVRASLFSARRAGAALSPESLLDIADTLAAAARLRAYFEARAAKYPRLWDVASAFELCRSLVEAIGRAIDPGGFVADGASPKLARLRRELDAARQELRAGLERMLARLDSAGAINDRLIAMRDGRPVIPVRASHKNSVPGIVHDQSATGQTLFVEPMEAVEDSNRIRQIEIAEQREVERILVELTDRVRADLPGLEADVAALREIDARYAIAAYAVQSDAIAPRISDDGEFALIRMRHPLLDARLRKEKKGAVPLTCRLAPDARLVVISGPNAGGKTVALKTIGLAIAMTQAGFLIPADHLTALPVFGTLFAEIGDEQSIEQDLSTFTSRIGHLARISDEADDRTLILVDELGSATDPEQGAALSRAILDRWAERGAHAIATTHLGNLKEFAHERPWAVNASMEFDRTTLQPTFRLIVGIPGSSYALEISRRVGLDPDLIAVAERELGETAVHTEALIAELAQRLDAARRAEDDVARRERELAARETEFETRFATVSAERKRIVRDAHAKADRVLSDARALVERTVAEIRRSNAASDAIRDARGAIQEATRETRESIRSLEQERVSPPVGLAVGNWVRLKALGTTGELVSLEKDRGAVQTATARLEVPLEQIEKVADEPPERTRGGVAVKTGIKDTFRTEVDVRGMTFDDAWDVVDQYLDQALVAHYPKVRIIHGKGTGALRTKLTQQLSNDDRVLSTQLGELYEGGIGVTVVEIRH